MQENEKNLIRGSLDYAENTRKVKDSKISITFARSMSFDVVKL